jgi:hypothetical protein
VPGFDLVAVRTACTVHDHADAGERSAHSSAGRDVAGDEFDMIV